MSWTPWQDAQLATVWEPERSASPWKLSRNDCTFPAGRLYRAARRSSPWHRPHVTLETRAGFTSEPGSDGARMACSPWQSVQTGAPGTLSATALPWTLPA